MSVPEPHSYGQGTSGEDFMRPFYWADEVEAIVAELATMKARRCQDCQHFGVCEVNRAAWVQFVVVPFNCCCWQARP